jgi:hypothetical protein
MVISWSALSGCYSTEYYGDAGYTNKDDMIHYRINDVGRDTASASRVYIALIIRYYNTYTYVVAAAVVFT